MTTFSFPYREERTREGTVVFRPSVHIQLQGSDGRWQWFRLYADAGADITLLTQTDCQQLGYRLEAGEEQLMGGICSGLVRTYVHCLHLKLGTEVLPCKVAFAERDVPRLLGRASIFRHFTVCYDDEQRVTKFILKTSQARVSK